VALSAPHHDLDGQCDANRSAVPPACAVFFLLAFRFGLENYQIRQRRKVGVLEFLGTSDGFWPR
jgi:hypothetical protein